MKITFKSNLTPGTFLDISLANIAGYSGMPKGLSTWLDIPNDDFRSMVLHAPNSSMTYDRWDNTLTFEGPRRSLHDAFYEIIPLLKEMDVIKFESWCPTNPWYEKVGRVSDRAIDVPEPSEIWEKSELIFSENAHKFPGKKYAEFGPGFGSGGEIVFLKDDKGDWILVSEQESWAVDDSPHWDENKKLVLFRRKLIDEGMRDSDGGYLYA